VVRSRRRIVKKKGFQMQLPTLSRLFALLLLCALLPTVPLVAAQVVPPATFFPLNQVPVPEPPNLFQFVKNKPAAIKLGKAFFWDMQVGSDGTQACGSCHFHAGADNRLKNTVNPGTRGGDNTFQVRGPNETLLTTDFPFHQRQNPEFQSSPVLRDANDIVGSQGVKFNQFLGINPGSPVDSGIPVPDPVFQAAGVNMRRVTPRNAPTVFNAVFNFNNFWDGRAHFAFNGVSPFGPLDTTAGVWFNVNGALQKQPVLIEFASLASQAMGPPLDDTEMSYTGRTFPQVGRKMLSLTPLAKQLVHPGDSVLGPVSKSVLQSDGTPSPDKGLKTGYQQMIQDAFQNNLWNAIPLTPDGFTQIEANFSLFWGLAIQLYEATLVSDQTPLDRFLGGDKTALTAQQQDGFNLFFGAAGCSACHINTELTAASVRSEAFITNAANAVIEPMVVANGNQIIYDNGFNNTAVRPTTDDIGRGGISPFTNPLTGLPFPLSFSALAELQALGNLGFNPNLFALGTPATPILPPPIPANFPVANDGNFKVPGLRNVELTAPYFHDGGVMTLEDVVDFYTRGGNFPAANQASLDPGIVELAVLQNNPARQASLVAFLKSLTDERVRNESAPFDHPEIFVPNGDPEVISIPARDANGNAAPALGVSINQVATPTALPNQTIGGTVDPGSTLTVTLDTQAFAGPVAVSGGSWSCAITGLVKGVNTVTVTATNQAGVSARVTAAIRLAAPLVLTLSPVATPTSSPVQVIAGTVDPGVTPVVVLSSAASAGPVTLDASGVNWSCTLTGLVAGSNGITVGAVDGIGNLSLKSASIDFEASDGDVNLDGRVDVSDALEALRIAVGIVQPSAIQKLHADVAPLVGGKPAPNTVVDVSDALLILRKVVGLVSF
jgi:cytochrome c peroxidase